MEEIQEILDDIAERIDVISREVAELVAELPTAGGSKTEEEIGESEEIAEAKEISQESRIGTRSKHSPY